MVTLCAARRLTQRPPRPATIAPRSGAKAMMTASSFSESRISSLERVEVLDVDGIEVAEKHHQDREADRRLGRRHREDEKYEHLAGGVAEEVREGDEVQVDGEQHQLDRHQQNDQVAAVEEDPDHADREQDRAQHQVVRQLDRPAHSFSTGMATRRTRSSRRTRICSAGACTRVSLRRRSVSAMAAMMATSRITAAISKA